jgi:hypothetical protein
VKALASERELIVILLDPDAITDSGPTTRHYSGRDGDSSKGESDVTFVLDRIFEGACRPFKVRVEQVLQSQPNLIVSFKLSNTLEFYGYTVSLEYYFFSAEQINSCFSLHIIPFDFRYQNCLVATLHCAIQYGHLGMQPNKHSSIF